HLLVYTSTHVVFDLRRRLFQHLQMLHLAFYEREQSGKLVAKLITDASALQILIQQALPVLSVNGFTILVTFFLMFLISPSLTLFSLIILPCYLLVSYYFRARLYRRSMQVRERNSVVAGNINEVITGIKVVKSFGMQYQENRRFVSMIRENLDYEIDLATIQGIRSSTLEFITGATRAAVLLIGGYAVMRPDPSMTVGDYVAFLGFVMMLFSPMQQIANLAIQVINARTGLERVLHILRIKPEVVDRPNAKKVDRLDGHVKLVNVCFGYKTGGRVLHNINIDAQTGEVVAFVGPSGSGKSTIVNLLTRFYDPTQGYIQIDGIDLRDMEMKSYQSRVGIVLQEPFLFSGTIYDNICYGSERASYRQVVEAARQANALEFIEELPNGMRTQVGERGQLLSGGQRQRISIARALLKDPDILILDEATSALDTQSERLVQQALDRLMRGRTVFVIAHRLTTIENADKIVVLDRGQIVEVGTHEELLDQGELYASLYSQDQEMAQGSAESDVEYDEDDDENAAAIDSSTGGLES
ncbi:MAG: ABC transporter ATP-binding protein, partial [Candidatus Sumerlaeota bacterium]